MRVFSLSATAALAAGAIFAAGPATAQVAAVDQQERNGAMHVRLTPPNGALAGWQALYNYPVPMGRNLIFSYKCPAGAGTPVNGSFYPNTAARAGLSLVGNYVLQAQASWGWAISWPSGAPSGAKITFNVYCVH